MSNSVSPHGASTEASPPSRAPAEQGAGRGREQGEDLSSGNPIHPPSSTSTCEPADQTAAASGAGTPTMDGWRSSDQIRALCDAATPGPWSFYLGDLWAGATADELATADRLSAEHVFSDEAEDIFERASHLFHGDPVRPEDAAFIAAARELVPQLLAEVEAAHRFEQQWTAESVELANTLNAVAAERDLLRGVVQAVEALAAKWANGGEVSEWNPLDELRAALGGTLSEPRDEHWWAAKALMAICDNATTWQSDSGDLYRPLLVGVTEAAHVVGRMIVAALAAAADAPQPPTVTVPLDVFSSPVDIVDGRFVSVPPSPAQPADPEEQR